MSGGDHTVAQAAPGQGVASRPGPGPAVSWLRQRLRLRVPKGLGRGVVSGIPLGWLLVFFLLPFAVVLKISLADTAIAMPPYTALLDWDGEAVATLQLNFGKYLFLLEDTLYLAAYAGSLKVAAVSTLFCLLIGYPMALFIARQPAERRPLWLALVILPFWTSLLLRVYAWIGLLQHNGVINNILISLGIIDQPLVMMQTDFAVYLGVVYTYLPFMVLPLYATLEKLDDTLLEAAADLGSAPWKAFLTVTLPLSRPGMVAGSMLVFIPAVGEFVIPALMGGPDTLMIGRVLWDEFFNNRDWPMASAVAVVMMVVLVIPVMLLRNGQNKTAEHG